MFGLPTTATAPFCPSEVSGTVRIDTALPWWRKALQFAGPGLLVSVGYMDPGNWATDIEGGARFGYSLLWVVAASSLAAVLLQCLSARLGLATGRDLARLCRDHYSPRVTRGLWILAELSIVACDIAEVLGCALAFHLLFGVGIATGVLLTAVDTVLVLGLKDKGFRRLEAIMLALVGTIALCFCAEVVLSQPEVPAVLAGLVPHPRVLADRDALYLAIGILGATVMPHNLYLHSSIVQTRVVARDAASRRDAIKYFRLDTIVSLLLAMLVNCAILVVAGAVFHVSGHRDVNDISDAYRLLEPLVGTASASILFGIALLASGQSSTFTGTITGQILMEGFLDLKIPCWQRHVITRALALVPALVGVLVLGSGAVGKLLVLSQVVLSLQLPFALYPLVRFSGDRRLMGEFASNAVTGAAAWLLFGVISAANLWLVMQFL